MKRFLMTVVVCAVVVSFGATVAVAGEASGRNVVVPKPVETTDLGNGMVYETTTSNQVCITTDPSPPLNRASGDCSGGCVSSGEGEPSCLGSCTWADADGDLAFFTWTGQIAGTWKMQGGTGKWATASGGGTWSVTGAYAGGMGENSWKGTIEME